LARERRKLSRRQLATPLGVSRNRLVAVKLEVLTGTKASTSFTHVRIFAGGSAAHWLILAGIVPIIAGTIRITGRKTTTHAHLAERPRAAVPQRRGLDAALAIDC
jgi:hypothetical protein